MQRNYSIFLQGTQDDMNARMEFSRQDKIRKETLKNPVEFWGAQLCTHATSVVGLGLIVLVALQY